MRYLKKDDIRLHLLPVGSSALASSRNLNISPEAYGELFERRKGGEKKHIFGDPGRGGKEKEAQV